MSMIAVKILLSIAAIFVALSLVSALMLGRRRDAPVGPHSHLYRDMPGFSRDQLERIARLPVPPHYDHDQVADGVALRSVASGGAVSSRPKPSLALPFNQRRQHRAS